MKNKQTLVFHIGAHKTATTHFQNTLNKLRQNLVQQNVFYTELETSRKRFNKYFFMSGIKYFLFSISPIWLKVRILESIFGINSQFQTFIFSEENILGSMEGLLSVKPYPIAEARLSFLNYLATKYDVRLYLSIRSFSDIYPGAYVTALKFYPERIKVAKDTLLDDIDNGELPSWVKLIKRMKRATPNISLSIWTHEYYQMDKLHIISDFTGYDMSSLPNVTVPWNTATPSMKGVEEIEENIQNKANVSPDWKTFCNNIIKNNLPVEGSPKYTFLSDKQQKSLHDQYLVDLDSLNSTMKDVRMFKK